MGCGCALFKNSKSRFASLLETDQDAHVGFGDIIAYHLENAVAANASVPFYLLIGLCAVISVGNVLLTHAAPQD